MDRPVLTGDPNNNERERAEQLLVMNILKDESLILIESATLSPEDMSHDEDETQVTRGWK